MKALYLAPGRDLTRADAGTTHTLGIVRALSELGHEVTLCAQTVPDGHGNLRFIEAPPRGRLGFLFAADPPESLLACARKADVIQERAEESGGIGVRLAAAVGKPLVLEINTPLSGHRNRLIRKVADWNLRRQAAAASAVITQTPIARTIIERYAAAPVFVVPNGADPQVFKPDLPPHEVPGTDKERRIIGFAGSLRPWHGVEDLIEAGREVLKSQGEAFFLFVGGGPREEALRKMASERLGEGNFHFTGSVEPARVPSYLAAAEILAAPFAPSRDPVRSGQFARYSMWWSPVKIFEYMAMGKPIVASAAGMAPEYLAGAGAIYAPGDVQGLAETIARLIREGALRAGMGNAARKRLLAEYTWRHAAERTASAWRETVRERQRVVSTR